MAEKLQNVLKDLATKAKKGVIFLDETGARRVIPAKFSPTSGDLNSWSAVINEIPVRVWFEKFSGGTFVVKRKIGDKEESFAETNTKGEARTQAIIAMREAI